MESKDFIPGIYNYCDTWCERCLLTTRCQSFQMQQQPAVEPGTVANSGEALVQQLTEALAMTKQYLDKLREQSPELAPDNEVEAEKRALEEQAAFRRQQAKNHPVAQLSRQYMHLSGDWLRNEADLLKQAGLQQMTAVELGISDQDEAMERLNSLKDAWDMIKWYRTLIPVKAMSALRVLTDKPTDAVINDYYVGKAKLVLVCVDRSLWAWETMVEQYPDKTDDILDALVGLSQLRRAIEELFPQARAFLRPGLD